MNKFMNELNSMKTIDFWHEFIQNTTTSETTSETTTDDKKMSSIGLKPSFSSSSFFDVRSHPTIKDQVVLCRQIARQLVCDENNAKSKGRKMFEKRVEKSSKWVTTDDNTDDDNESHHETTISEGPVNLKLLLDPRHVQDLNSLEFISNESEMNRERQQSQSKEILQDLNSPETNKGNSLFMRRQEKSVDWIVDSVVESVVSSAEKKKRDDSDRQQLTTTTRLEVLPKVLLLKTRDFNARARPFSRS